MTIPHRFCDMHETRAAFLDEVLVVCPQCGAYARVVPRAAPQGSVGALCRLTCPMCGTTKDRCAHALHFRTAHDPYFGYPVWLQTAVGGQRFWAYNRRHLQVMRAFVRALLRERRADPATGWRNTSMISRLPGWVKARRHRPHLLKAIARMQQRVRKLGGS